MKATITLSSGTTVVIEGTPEEIVDALARIEHKQKELK